MLPVRLHSRWGAGDQGEKGKQKHQMKGKMQVEVDSDWLCRAKPEELMELLDTNECTKHQNWYPDEAQVVAKFLRCFVMHNGAKIRVCEIEDSRDIVDRVGRRW